MRPTDNLLITFVCQNSTNVRYANTVPVDHRSAMVTPVTDVG